MLPYKVERFAVVDSLVYYFNDSENHGMNSKISCQKGLTRHAYAWQIGSFLHDTLDMSILFLRYEHKQGPYVLSYGGVSVA